MPHNATLLAFNVLAKQQLQRVRRYLRAEAENRLSIECLTLKRNFGRNSIVAKKNKGVRNELSADTGSSDKPVKIKARGRSASAKRKKSPPRKKSAAQRPNPPTAAPLGPDLTNEQIQTRAYFISERRRRFDLPGDANSDWLEAKRQLLAEIGPR